MTYKIGTRVKKVRVDNPATSANIGKTGLVVGRVSDERLLAEGRDIMVRVDTAALDINGTLWPAGTVMWCKSGSWEPIVPDGHTSSEWAETLCNPDGTFNPDAPLPSFKEELEYEQS